MGNGTDGVEKRRRPVGRAEPMIVCPCCATQVPVRLITGPIGAKKLECPGCRATVPV